MANKLSNNSYNITDKGQQHVKAPLLYCLHHLLLLGWFYAKKGQIPTTQTLDASSVVFLMMHFKPSLPIPASWMNTPLSFEPF